jgi:hypothetical protein
MKKADQISSIRNTVDREAAERIRNCAAGKTPCGIGRRELDVRARERFLRNAVIDDATDSGARRAMLLGGMNVDELRAERDAESGADLPVTSLIDRQTEAGRDARSVGVVGAFGVCRKNRRSCA